MFVELIRCNTGPGMIPILFSSYRIFTLYGTCAVRVHALAPAIGLWALVLSGNSQVLLFWASLWMAALTHAFGHLFCSRYFYQTPQFITLYPFHSTFRLDYPPASRKIDLAITAAGPSLNLVIGGLLYLFSQSAGETEIPHWSAQLARLQITYGLITLLPMYPLDGSRLMRLGLQFRNSLERSNEIANFLGQTMAATIVLWSFFQGFYKLGFIGIIFYVVGRFSNFFQRIIRHSNASEIAEEMEIEEDWEDGEPPITMTMTQDGVWEQLEREPSTESRMFF
jgi:Zn-dependent protease